ncbi:hypothetical protein KC315_g4318 [Hortaea werneckii]|nr:hypothetical protein KC315_g4318 [Hortaea werneckii]
MTKKKRNNPDVEELLERPWCYYCERDFDDLKILIQHQKAKHFKCERCGRRLNTAGGLGVHMNQVHKEPLTEVENALPNRLDAGVEIFGMEGIPEEILGAHRQRVTEAFFRSEADHRAKTGNPPPGGKAQGGEAKRPKLETMEETLERLADFKAKKAAEKAGLASNPATPANVGGYEMPPTSQQPTTASTQSYGTTALGGLPTTSSSPLPGYGMQQQNPQSAYYGYGGSPATYQQYPPSNPYSPAGQGMQAYGYGMPPQSSGPPSMSYGQPPSAGPYGQQWSPPAQHSSAGPPSNAPGMNPGLPQPSPGLPQRPSFQAPNLSKEEMAKMHSGFPSQHASHPQYQQATNGAPIKQEPSNKQEPSIKQEQQDGNSLGDSIDDLIKSVTSQPQYTQPPQYGLASHLQFESREHDLPAHIKVEPNDDDETPGGTTSAGFAQAAHENGTGIHEPLAKDFKTVTASNTMADVPNAEKAKKSKKSKKNKDASKIQLVYSDEIVSPEEKLATKPRYAFERNEKTDFVRGEISGAVTGATEDTVRDPQDTGE